MLKMYERYQNDPLFNRIVDLMVGLLLEGTMTPTEVREAAMLAQIKVEDMRPRPTTFTKDQVMRGEV